MSGAVDTVLRGGRVVLPGRSVTKCDVAIREGRIAAILAPDAPCDMAEVVNVRGLVVLPGALDVHLHLGHGNDIACPRDPADAAQESAGAAAGGITTFIPYLMATEPFAEIFDAVVAVTEAGSRVDFGYHPIICTEAQLAEVPNLISRGAPSFKIFMNNRGGEGRRLGMPDLDDGFLFRLCEAAAEHGGMVCPHPETIEIAWALRDRMTKADPDGEGGLATWNATRPPFVEADAVQRAAYIAGIAGAPLYVVHTSSAEAMRAACRHRGADARAPVYIETCPHYLTHDETWEGGVVGKINPPLRAPADREALWRGVLDGTVDTIATDHVHRPFAAKSGNVWTASPGCPGMETMLPILLSEGHAKRGLALERIADLTATNPARIMGLGRAKGAIAPGLDADLAVVDPAAKWTVTREGIHSSAGYSIYEGWELTGRVVHTLVRGCFVLRDGALVSDAIGTGRYVRREQPGRT